MSEHQTPAEKHTRRRWALSITNAGGDEVRVSLHPISLARLLAEAIEDAATSACRRRGHVHGQHDEGGYCAHCGISLPDDSPYESWLPDAYRTIRNREVSP